MTQQTKIEWCDFTVNFWEGCQKVGPGCDNCYAEARDARFTGGQHWGPGAPRRKVKNGPAKLRKIHREALAFAEEHGHLPRAFLSSLCDMFDNAVTPAWRREAFKEIEAAFRVRIIMLTKRVGNVFQMVPPAWVNGGWPSHVGLMITVVNQDEADRDIPKLLDLKAKLGIPWVGLSVEPMLGPLQIDTYLIEHHFPGMGPMPPEVIPSVDWVICGGESGRNARPMHPDWVRGLKGACESLNTAFFFKQWGRWLHESQDPNAVWDWEHADARGILHCWDNDDPFSWSIPLKKADAGRLLDGVEHNGFPEALMGGEG